VSKLFRNRNHTRKEVIIPMNLHKLANQDRKAIKLASHIRNLYPDKDQRFKFAEKLSDLLDRENHPLYRAGLRRAEQDAGVPESSDDTWRLVIPHLLRNDQATPTAPLTATQLLQAVDEMTKPSDEPDPADSDGFFTLTGAQEVKNTISRWVWTSKDGELIDRPTRQTL
jgi:hypothetical protein